MAEGSLLNIGLPWLVVTFMYHGVKAAFPCILLTFGMATIYLCSIGLPAPLHSMCPMGRHFYRSHVMDTKPATSYEEQVAILERRGLIIDDEDSCIAFLKNANYYRFTAYLLPFKTSDDRYAKGISFHKVRRIYDFDARLRNLLFRIIEVIELYLRTQLAYYFAHHYTPLGYLDSVNFSSMHKSDVFLRHVEKCIEDNRNTPIVSHHNEKYGGRFPIWVIVEFLSMGMLSYFYADLKSQDQKEIVRICQYYSVPIMRSWLRCLTELRNRCAHYSRLYYWNFISIPSMPSQLSYPEHDQRSLFRQILMLRNMCPSKSDWDLFKADLITLIDRYSNSISLMHIGFPENWIEIL